MTTAVGLAEYIRRGAHDDGHEGVVLTKLAQGELVKVPFRSAQQRMVSTSPGSASFTAQTNSNEDGSGGVVQLNVAPAVLPAGSNASVRTQLWGRQVGVRWRRDTSATVPLRICALVDGVAHWFDNTKPWHGNLQEVVTDAEALWLIADDLDDGPHTVEIILAQDPAGSATYVLNVYGWLAERRAGYEPKLRPGLLQAAPTSLTASAVAIPNVQGGTTSTDLRGVRKLHFYNTDTVTRTVTIKQGSNILKVIALATVTHGEYDFGEAVNIGANLTWQADVTSVVNAWVQGDV